MNIPRILYAPVLLFLTPLFSVNAAVVNYDESAGGDLPSSSFELVFDFDTGINTIQGSQSMHVDSIANGGSITTDEDQFRFTIPADNQLTAIDFTFTNLALDTSLSSVYIAYSVQDLPYTFIEGSPQLNLRNETPNTLITLFPGSSNFPLSSGLYDWGHSLGAGGLGADGYGGSWDFTLRFHVTAIPVPATAWLFSSGLLGLVCIARRKKAA